MPTRTMSGSCREMNAGVCQPVSVGVSACDHGAVRSSAGGETFSSDRLCARARMSAYPRWRGGAVAVAEVHIEGTLRVAQGCGGRDSLRGARYGEREEAW